MIVSRMISWLYFLMSPLALPLMVFFISAYSIRCLLPPFPPHFSSFRDLGARVGDDILDFHGLLIVFVTLLDRVCDSFAQGVDVV